jgi:hypothetical protein
MVATTRISDQDVGPGDPITLTSEEWHAVRRLFDLTNVFLGHTHE